MEDLFSIGELSRYQNISRQTLIFYDKIGLFCPAYVDPHNGYRYYSASQIDYLDTILIMKKIGFSLDEIKEHMLHYNIDSSLAALKRQVSVIDRQIQELRLIRNRVLHRCGQMEEAKEHHRKPGRPVSSVPESESAIHPERNQHRHQTVLCGFLSEASSHLFSDRRHCSS